MIDINLLNKKGIYSSNNSEFNNIDEDLEKIEDNLKPSSANINDEDFESNYNNKNNDVKAIRGKKKPKFLMFLVVIAAIGLFAYYQFFNFVKTEIYSENIEELISYVLNSEDMSIKQMKINNNSFDMSIGISQKSFNKYKAKIGSHFDKMNALNSFDYMLSDEILNIKSSNSINIINTNFDELADVQQFELSERNDISQNELKLVLDSIFKKINNQKLINFEITSSDISSYYNIVFFE